MLLVLLLAGCKVGQNYQRPDVAVPTRFRSAATTDSGTVARVPWRDFFGNPELQQLISTSLEGNFDLQIAMKRIEESRAYVRQTRYALLPAVNGQIAASTITPSKNSLNGLSLENFLGAKHLEDYSANIALSWEADIWGKIRRQNEATRATYLQTEEAAKAVRTNLVANVANGYFNLLLLDAQLDIAKRNLALSDTIVRVIQLQKDGGEVTELAVEQAQAQRQTAALLQTQLEQAIVIEENGLRQLLGDMPGSVPRSTRLDAFPVADTLLSGVPAQLLANRPDVRVSELGLVAANARIGVAQANMYPALVITAGGGLNAFRASNWFVLPSSLFYTVAGGLTQPIFQRRQLKTQLEVAKIQQEQAVIQFRQAITNGVRDVSDALVQVEKLKQQEQVAAARVVTLKGAITNAKLLFTSGLANYLEVITAQSNVLQAELTLAEVKQQRLRAMVSVYRALGGGWQ
ncbi:RND efflux system, outer membrane lipoprotein, NodT family [Fibrisoma limi BUZ 3]|uniref:RND efflux system, outer membrane lipoprotein, NodT family n=1 Tax=Fibrisoma limi BUZ 3 TaxID=1185876 RepID=I2GG36_9BACT|nr:efflux transporter outer membrane subunit [Fibrisoma limi]CCH52861.1 RND efflux system, outer membrane lipoprotein, NodT family [Fibrisoma limi BUZ 3]